MTESKKCVCSQLAKLINVKSLVTVMLTVVFVILSLNGSITGQEFMTVFTVVIAFYYGTQAGKNSQCKEAGQ